MVSFHPVSDTIKTFMMLRFLSKPIKHEVCQTIWSTTSCYRSRHHLHSSAQLSFKSTLLLNTDRDIENNNIEAITKTSIHPNSLNTHGKWPKPEGPQLRDYQMNCIEQCIQAFEDGKRRIAVSLATGGGKTLIFSHLMSYTPSLEKNSLKKQEKVLVLAHRKELVLQAKSTIETTYPGLDVQVEMSTERATDSAHVVVASVQSLVRKGRLDRFDPEDFKLIIIDEAHHAAANSYLKILQHFDATSSKSKTFVVGFSATFERLDGLALTKAMDHVVYERGLVDMINSQHLCDVRIVMVNTKMDLKKVKKSKSDFEVTSLGHAINIKPTNDLVYKSWKHQCDTKNIKSTLGFCVNIDHVKSLSSTFQNNGVNAQYLTSETPSETRSNILQDFKDGKIPVLLNCGILTEGTDIPNIDCLLLVRPTKSRSLLVQMIGRGLRLHKSKEICTLIDFVGGLEHGVQTSSELLGLSPELVERGEDNEAKPEIAPGLKKSDCFEDYEDTKVVLSTYDGIGNFLADSSSIKKSNYHHFFTATQNSWIPISSTCYILGLDDRFIKIEREDKNENYSIFLQQRYYSELKKKSFWKKSTVAENLASIELAFRAADSYAATIFDRSYISRSANWRKAPISESQIKALKRYFKKLSTTIRFKQRVQKEGLSLELDLSWLNGLTKGDGSNYINRIVYSGSSGLLNEYVVRSKAYQKNSVKPKYQEMGGF